MRTLRLWMRTFWKEWRDHRAMVIALAVTIPALTGLACWVFGARLSAQSTNTLAMIFVPLPLGLVFFAIAADLVAGEQRQKTIQLVRRLPGALVRTFVAKWCFLFVVTLGLVLWQGLVLAFLVTVFHEAGTMTNGFATQDAILAQLAACPSSLWWQLTLLGCIATPWAFVVSTWLGRSGAAAIASLLVLGAMVAPWLTLVYTNPWFMPLEPSDLPVIAMVLIGMALLVGAISYLSGLRWHGKPWRPALVGLTLVGMISAGGYVHARTLIDSWLAFGPETEEFSIHSAFLAEDGKTLYVNATRGSYWLAGRSAHGWMDKTGASSDWTQKRGTPLQTWVVDLESGALDRQSTDGHTQFMPHVWLRNAASNNQLGLARCETMTRVRLTPQTAGTPRGSGITEVEYFDAATGESIATLPDETTSLPVEKRLVRELRNATPFRTPEGQRAWIRRGRIEVEGAEDLSAVAEGRVLALGPRIVLSSTWPLGWIRYQRRGDEASGLGLTFHGVDGSPARELAAPDGIGGDYDFLSVVGPKTVRGRAAPSGDPEPDILWDLETGEVLGKLEHAPRHVLGEVRAGRWLYATTGAEGRTTLKLYDVAAGTSRAVALEGGALEGTVWQGRHGRLPDGRFLAQLLQLDKAEGGGASSTRQLFLVFDQDESQARIVGVGPSAEHYWGYVTFLDYSDENGLMIVEGNKRVVRFDPRNPRKRTIVWGAPD